MRIGVLGTGRIGLMHARNLPQTTGVDEVSSWAVSRSSDRLTHPPRDRLGAIRIAQAAAESIWTTSTIELD
jgi:predicted dehydrogenase